MKDYSFEAKFVVSGIVKVNANSMVEAKELFRQQFGGIIIDIGHGIVADEIDTEGIIDWDFNTKGELQSLKPVKNEP